MEGWAMFNKKSIDTYKSMKASANLRERVINIQPLKKSTKLTIPFGYRYRGLYAYAACLVLLLTITFAVTQNNGNITVYVEGNEVGSTPIQVYPSTVVKPGVRGVPFGLPTVSVQMEINVDKSAEISVSDGMLIRSDDESQMDNQGMDELQISGDEKIIWDVGFPSIEDTPRMTIKLQGKVLIYLLEFNESAEIWTIKLDNKS
jgi:hypothetical protein